MGKSQFSRQWGDCERMQPGYLMGPSNSHRNAKKKKKKKKLQSQFLGQTRERELHTRILNQMQQPLLFYIYCVCVYKDICIYIDTHIASKYEEWHWLSHKQAACWLSEIKRRFDLIRRALLQWERGASSLALWVLRPRVSYGSHSISDSILIHGRLDEMPLIEDTPQTLHICTAHGR